MGINDRTDVAGEYQGIFVALITNSVTGNPAGYFADQTVYSWTEQTYEWNTGQPTDQQLPRTGTYDESTDTGVNVALEPNGRLLEPGSYVYLRVKGYVGDVLVYEAIDFPEVTWAEVTSDIVSGGWYPAILQSWDADTQAWYEPQRWDVTTQAWVDGGCWVQGPNGETLVVGTRYAVSYVGLYSAVQSYMTMGGDTGGGGGGGQSDICQEVVIGQQCVDGELVTTTLYYRVTDGVISFTEDGCDNSSSSSSAGECVWDGAGYYCVSGSCTFYSDCLSWQAAGSPPGPYATSTDCMTACGG